MKQLGVVSHGTRCGLSPDDRRIQLMGDFTDAIQDAGSESAKSLGLVRAITYLPYQVVLGSEMGRADSNRPSMFRLVSTPLEADDT